MFVFTDHTLCSRRKCYNEPLQHIQGEHGRTLGFQMSRSTISTVICHCQHSPMDRNNEALLTILYLFYNGLWNPYVWMASHMFPPSSSLDPMRCVGCLTTASPEYHTTDRERPGCLRGEVDVPCAFEQVGRSKETVSADEVNGRPPRS